MLPNWRTPRETPVPMAPDAEKKLVEHLRLPTDAPMEGDAVGSKRTAWIRWQFSEWCRSESAVGGYCLKA